MEMYGSFLLIYFCIGVVFGFYKLNEFSKIWSAELRNDERRDETIEALERILTVLICFTIYPAFWLFFIIQDKIDYWLYLREKRRHEVKK